MLKPTAAIVAAAALVLTGSAYAQSSATFESLDKNADGQISLSEASANDELFVEFKRLDTNKDGMLSKQEYAAYKKS